MIVQTANLPSAGLLTEHYNTRLLDFEEMFFTPIHSFD